MRQILGPTWSMCKQVTKRRLVIIFTLVANYSLQQQKNPLQYIIYLLIDDHRLLEKINKTKIQSL